MEKQKRERSVNFTPDETDLLVSLAEVKKHILENKKSDAATWQDKEKAWKEIETEFNASSKSVFRDHKHLKLKYEAIKRDTRRKSAVIRADRYSTGTRAPVLTPAEQKVKEMILLSDEGNESSMDSDMVMPYTSNILEISIQDSEPPKNKVCEVPVSEEAVQSETNSATNNVQNHEQCKEWNPPALNTKDIPVLNKPKKKRPLDNLTEEKIHIAKLRKQIVTEELEQKIVQRRILEKELEHKYVIHDLEKQHLLLKIELLKKDLEKK